MRHLILLVSSAAAIAIGSCGVALADPDIYVSGAIGGAHHVSDGGYIDYGGSGLALQGAGSIAVDLTPTLGAQGDVVANDADLEFDSFDNSSTYDMRLTSLDGALHGFYRDSERFLVGVFGQFGSSRTEYTAWLAPELSRTFAGIEGQAFLDSLTLYGQLGALHAGGLYQSRSEADGWFGTAELRYFITPNFKVEVHAGLSTLSTLAHDLDLETRNVTLGASAEYRLDDSPLSLFAKVDYLNSTYDFWEDYTTSSTRLLVGLKFNLGTDTLLDRDRSGASLKPVEADLAFYDYPSAI